MLTKVVALVIGLLLAAFAQFTALLLNAVGEGWGAPGLVNLVLFIVLPAGLFRIVDRNSESVKGDILLILALVAADAMLVLISQSEGRYFCRGLHAHPVVDVWLTLWAFGHLVPITTMALKFRRMPR